MSSNPRENRLKLRNRNTSPKRNARVRLIDIATHRMTHQTRIHAFICALLNQFDLAAVVLFGWRAEGADTAGDVVGLEEGDEGEEGAERGCGDEVVAACLRRVG